MADFNVLSRQYLTGETPRVDVMGPIAKGYQLAGAITDTQAKIREQQQTAGDINAMQGFLRSGGDLHSNEGWDKALTELKGVISPKSYMELVAGKQKFQANTQKQIEALAEQPEKVIKAARTTNDEILRTFEGISEVYDKASKANDPEALAKFQAAKAANLQRLRELPGMNNQQALARFESMSPEQLGAEIRATEHYGKVLDESTKARKQLAEARKAEAAAKQIEEGGTLGYAISAYDDAVEEYNALLGQFPPDSPEVKQARDKVDLLAAKVRSMQGGAKATAAPSPTQIIDDATINTMAEQYLAGDKSVFTNLGRGTQGAENIARLRSAVAALAKKRGMSGKDIALAMQEFQGLGAGERALGTRIANIEMAVNEATQLATLAEKASAEWKRTGIKSVNDLIKYGQSRTASPELRAFVAANNSFINAYARAINPTGVPTDSDKNHAREMLDIGFSRGDYQAALNQLKQEMDAARKSPELTKQTFRKVYGEKERGADDLETLIKQMETALADTKPGTGSYDRIKKDLDEARGELAKLKPGAPTAAAPTAPTTPAAPTKAGPPKLNSFNDLKRLVSEGKLKKGDEFIGPDGKSYTVKKLPE